MKLTIVQYIKYVLIPKIKTPYYYLFTFIVWQPFFWDKIKPKDGIIDASTHWFYRHSVRCLNEVRGKKDTFYLMKFMGIMIRDPHSYPQRDVFNASTKHLFVTRK